MHISLTKSSDNVTKPHLHIKGNKREDVRSDLTTFSSIIGESGIVKSGRMHTRRRYSDPTSCKSVSSSGHLLDWPSAQKVKIKRQRGNMEAAEKDMKQDAKRANSI